jgi:hypothetical protein
LEWQIHWAPFEARLKKTNAPVLAKKPTLHKDLEGIFEGFIEVAESADGAVSPANAKAWFEMHGILDQGFWWQMFRAMDAVRLAAIRNKK